MRSVVQAAHRIDHAIEVIAGDVDARAPAQYIADRFWEMPETRDEQLPSLLAGCRARGVGTVIPSRDGELSFWARYAAQFSEAGIAVVVSDFAAVERCIDKLAFAEFCVGRKLPAIPASAKVDGIRARRYVVKERFGAGSRMVGANLDRDTAEAHAARLVSPLFQPYVAGIEISVDAWVDRRHRVIGAVLRYRDRVAHGESQVTTTFRDQAIEMECVRTLEALQLRGPVVLQAVMDAAGGVHVIEVNARFGGASTAGIAAGLDPWYWSLIETRGGEIAADHFRRVSGEIRQVRLPSDIIQYVSDLRP